MSILQVVGILIVIGVLLYLANNYLPMDPKIKQILNAVVVIAVVVWLLLLFFPGVMHSLGAARIGSNTHLTQSWLCAIASSTTQSMAFCCAGVASA